MRTNENKIESDKIFKLVHDEMTNYYHDMFYSVSDDTLRIDSKDSINSEKAEGIIRFLIDSSKTVRFISFAFSNDHARNEIHNFVKTKLRHVIYSQLSNFEDKVNLRLTEFNVIIPST